MVDVTVHVKQRINAEVLHKNDFAMEFCREFFYMLLMT